MAKTLKFAYKGVDYELEYTRETVKQMEAEGFVLENVATKPMNTLPKLFAGAFKANHRYVKHALVNEMFEKLTNKQALLEKLIEMYTYPITTLMEDADEGNAIAWEATF